VVADLQELAGHLRGAESPAEALTGQRRASKPSPYKTLCLGGLAALDDLPGLLDAMGDVKEEPLFRTVALLALRGWVGRDAGGGRALYRGLQEKQGYSASDADDFVTLLYGYPQDRQADPKTYETLVGLLRSKRTPLRQLAVWQLSLLAPAESRQVKADIGTPDTLTAEWNKLLPKGQLPQQFRKEEK
jgi:hypothetical protein